MNNSNFKQTEVGQVPEKWKVVRLGDEPIAEIRGNKTINGFERVAFIPMELIPDSGVFVKYEIRPMEEVKSFVYCERGDLLLAKITPSLENGKQGIVPDDIPNGFALATTEVFPISCKNINRLFLFYELKFPKFRNKIIYSMIGTTGRQRASKESVEKLLIPLPPLPEQEKVAEILSTVDQAIEKVDEAIKKTQRLKNGLMQELLTKGIGHKEFKETEIGRIPREWNMMKLGEIANVRYGLGQPPAIEANGIPMIRATNVKRGRIAREGLIFINPNAVPNSRDPFLRAGDILVVRSGAYTGDVALVTKEWEGAIAGYDLIVTPSGTIDSQFLTYYLLSSPVQKRHFVGLKVRSAQPHLNSSQVEETPIPLPPLSEQQKIAEILSSADERLELLRKRKERLKRTKKGLMDVLLTGRKRVRLEV